MNTRVKFLILGGGISGLSCAYRLSQLGLNRIQLFEASNSVGGLSRSIHWGEYTFDLGPHQIHTDSDRVIETLKELFHEDLLLKKKIASQRFLGKMINYPLRINDLLYRLPFHISLTSFLSFLKQRLHNQIKKNQFKSFESWVVYQFGKKMYEIYFKPYTIKVWGINPAKITAQCAIERIAVQNLIDVLLNAFSSRFLKFSRHSNITHSPYQSMFFFPRIGIGALAEKMADQLIESGGKILLDTKIIEIVSHENSIVVVTEKGKSYRGDYLISTIPLDLLANMVGSADVREKPDFRLNYRSLIFIFLKVNKIQVSENHWIYFPDKDCIFQRSTEFKNFSNTMAPANKTGICLELPCDYEDKVWNMRDKDLFKKALRDAQRQKLIRPTDVEDYKIVRERYAYPSFFLGYEKKIREIFKYLDKYPRIYTIGRQGQFKYINVDDVMLMGFSLAEQLASML